MENGVNLKINELKEQVVSKDDIQDYKREFVCEDSLERAVDGMQRNIDKLMSKINDCESKRKTLALDLNELRSLFTEKVDLKDIQRIDQKLADCAPWEAVRNIFKELYLYLKRDDFDLYKTELKVEFQKFTEQINTLISKKEAMNEIN